jgi:hypothetical protein
MLLLSSAFALTCLDVKEMLTLKLPSILVVSAIQSSGLDTAGCLSKTPPDILEAARNSQSKPALPAITVAIDPMSASTEKPFLLAQSLDALGFSAAAEIYYIETLKAGLGASYFIAALERLTLLAFAGDRSTLYRVVLKIPPEQFPKMVADRLWYISGLQFYENENILQAM